MTDVAEASYLSHIINAFRLRAPNARLRTVSPISEALEEGLESGAVDLAIGYFPDIKNAGVFQQRLLRNSGFVCIVGHENRLIPRGLVCWAKFRLFRRQQCHGPAVEARSFGWKCSARILKRCNWQFN